MKIPKFTRIDFAGQSFLHLRGVDSAFRGHSSWDGKHVMIRIPCSFSLWWRVLLGRPIWFSAPGNMLTTLKKDDTVQVGWTPEP